ncbi:hypothetical protein QNH07_gp26 [Aeromonas phage BUCT696]|uniref:hypothetical protein n=1 Tax=Aeromonas phage BUCT696 TaxID=2911664 RepID=UPI0024ADF806|nr:hypothetical protein QNH07_gp26 [Aeromonas phage BUCT696]UKH48791.1 hypothetical protein [Aeromonas phage BUCT696]
MLVHKKEFSVKLTKPSGDTQVISWEKFLDIIIPRISYSSASVQKFLKAMAEMELNHVVVPGELINLKGWTVEVAK